MIFKRIGRLLVCLVLICALLINVSPIKARADVVSGGLIAAGTTGAVISLPAAIAIGATLVCLGVMVDTVSQNPFAFQEIASNVEQHLTAAGTYIKDGMVDMYRFVTETGEAVYYATSDFIESCRSYLFASGTVLEHAYADSGSFTLRGDSYSVTADVPFTLIAAWYPGTTSSSFGYVFAAVSRTYGVSDFYVNGNKKTPWMTSPNYNFYNLAGSSGSLYYSDPPVTNIRTIRVSSSKTDNYKLELENVLLGRVYTGLDISLGVVSTSPIDGTSARTWSESYANRGLYIASGGNQGAPDDGAQGNDGWKFLLPLTLVSGATLYAMSQADQWSGQTPQEFNDYTTKEELNISSAPEFDGYQAIEVTPAANPNPDIGGSPESGEDSSEITWWERFTRWFLDLKTSINELPNKFDEHFDNLNNNIQEVPNKFEAWIRGVQTSVDALADKIVRTAEQINFAIQGIPDKIQLGFADLKANVAGILPAIQNIPNAILNGLQTLFVPDPDYFAGKVESLKAKFPIVSNVQDLGNNMKSFFLSLGTKAPIIYIDLGASQWHPMGGRVKFIDLTWYAQYKPTMDMILGGFLWLWTGWRLLHAAPGIISGAAGTWGQPTSINDLTFMSYQPRLPSGDKRKKEE